MNANLPQPVVRLEFSVSKHPDPECARLIAEIEKLSGDGIEPMVDTLKNRLSARVAEWQKEKQ
jgi:hypothetical protein